MKKHFVRNYMMSAGWCLFSISGWALTSCSSEEDMGAENYASDTPSPIEFLEGGTYTGVWWIGDEKVAGDSFRWLYYEKTSQIPDSYMEEHDSYPTGINFTANKDASKYRLMLYEFPLKAFATKEYPDFDIAYVTTHYDVVGRKLDDEELLLYHIYREAELDGDNGTGTNEFGAKGLRLQPVGYSDKMVYFNIQSAEGVAYLRRFFAVTDKDGNYFAIVLDFLPSKSTATMDVTTKTLSLNLYLKQIETYDQDMHKTIRSLDQDTFISFTSTQKIN